MIIGKRTFDLTHGCYIMGILNVTPDSFSDGGKWHTLDKALYHVEAMIDEGADIIDVGGESTRPGYEHISVQDEIDRTLPVISALSSRFDVPISIDTSKSAVVEAALSAGVHLVNDIWGLKSDPDMAGVIARAGVPCCLMHNREDMDYTDFMRDLISDIEASLDLAKTAGIAADNIMIDPGIGFAKTHEMNLEAINKLDRLKALGYPVLLGASRKRVVGLTLDLPVEARVEGSIAAAIVGLMRGAAFVRVHDVKETYRAIKMTQAIIQT
ncbi:MAG: dihydropteroate synthase [Oscillospiraceae bacterium]|nr:dihydropteroate synthase [Oscillospiraceae bacterium]